MESYKVTVEGELEEEPFEVEVQEREYSNAEIQKIFAQMMKELDAVVLGENESCDRVEKNLNLVNQLEGYPVDIRWELDNYEVLDTEGAIQDEQTEPDGTMVEVRGILSYGSAEAVYVTHVMVYPETKEGKEKWIDAIRERIDHIEQATRQDETFSLPNSVSPNTRQSSVFPTPVGPANKKLPMGRLASPSPTLAQRMARQTADTDSLCPNTRSQSSFSI